MRIMKLLSGIGLAALLFWVLLMFMFILMGVGSFYVPTLVSGWKAQGLKEAPPFWQIVIDASDFCKLRWWIALPLLLVVAITLSVQAVRRRPE